MKDIINKGRMLSLVVYAFYGVAIIAGIFMDKGGVDSFSIATIFYWVVTFGILMGMRISELRHSFAYNVMYTLSLSIFAISLQLTFTSIFIVFIVFAITWLSVITFLDKMCFHITIIVQALCVVFLVAIPRQYSGLADFNITSLVFSFVGFIVADLVGNIIIDMLLTLDEETVEKERSLDDMLEIVETKNREARKLTDAKTNFLSNMSHELRTPLNAVIGFDEMILRSTDDPEIVEYAKDIKASGSMMLSLVNDILDLSKIESNKMTIVPVDFDIEDMIKDISNMIEPKMRDKKLEFILNFSPEVKGCYRGDDVRLKQVLVNILSNAAKYTREGSVTFTISGSRDDKEGTLHFSVKDTGIGIKPEDLSKLNRKFVRIDEEKNRNIEGTGLGISIVSNFLMLMGSTLCVDSVYGEGSDFYFDITLPVVSTIAKSAVDTKITHEIFVAEDMDVLVVDDTAVNLRVIKALLKRNKINVDTADSGKEAIEKASARKYDVIFLDRMMPEMDGVETLHNMKAIENFVNATTPVVALTADAVGDARKNYLELGFDDYIAKPIVAAELENILRRFHTGK